MEALYLLLAISMLVVLVVGLVFVWAVRDGQFDDLSAPAYRMLGDEDENPNPKPAAVDQAPPHQGGPAET